MRKMKNGTLFTLLLFGLQVVAQDIHFTQSSQTPLWINPATTGLYDGWERIIANHRNQWLGSNTQFMTTALSADINLLKTTQNDKAYLGLGLFLWNDQGGDANFGSKQGQLSISGIVPVADGHQVSAGLQGGLGYRGGNMNNLYFANQWNGSEFDQTLPSLESDRLQSNMFFDLSTGINYQYNNTATNFTRNETFQFQFGIAMYHVNKPNIKYYGLTNERLYRKLVLHTNFLKEFPGSEWGVQGSFVQFFQGSHASSLLGLMLRYRLKTGSKITTLRRDAHFSFGFYQRSLDAFAPAFLIELKGFQFGVSYDVTISSLRKTHSGGSIEFSLSYRNLSHAVFKRRR